MSSDLEKRNANATAAALRSISEDMTAMRAEMIEVKKTMAQLIGELQQIKQRQIHGLAGKIGTGATA